MRDVFYRVILFTEKQSHAFEKGGTLYVPREYQGEGRHDLTDEGILYASVEPISAVCESIKRFRNLKIDNNDFIRPDGQKMALVKIALDNINLIDLRDAKVLVKMNFTPADIATSDRKSTQNVSSRVYTKNADGFLWWSTLEAKWSNATLFFSRVSTKLQVMEEPVGLHVKNNLVMDAARWLNISL